MFVPGPEWWWSQGGIQGEVPEAGARVAQREGCVGRGREQGAEFGGQVVLEHEEPRWAWCGVNGFILIGMDVWRVLSRDVT